MVAERVRSATETANRPVDGTACDGVSHCGLVHVVITAGFVIEGFDLSHSADCVESILQTTTLLLPEGLPRYIHGMYTPGMYRDIGTHSQTHTHTRTFCSGCVYSGRVWSGCV